MRKLLATTLSAALLTTGGFGAANVLHSDKAEAASAKYEASYSNHGQQHNLNISADSLTKLPEYVTVASKINVNGLTAKVVADNNNKRIIVFSDSRGQGKYKSIFVKMKNNLKVIDFHGGEIFYGDLKSVDSSAETTKPDTKPAANQNSKLAEYTKLSTVVDISKLSLQVVEDNTSKRIITLQDQTGHVKYKSIFVKRTNMLKVINTKGGQVFYGSIK